MSNVASPRPAPGELPAWRTWLAIAFLGIGAFIIVTTELAPIGLLSPIAQDFGRSESTIGLTVSAYAWIGAASALASMLWLGKLPRKPLLAALMLGIAVSNGGAMLADSFGALMAARALGAVAHGLFWAVIGASAAQLAPPRHVGLATSIVFGGVSVASVLGVPVATLIGQDEGWRTAFGAAGLLSVAAAVGIAWVLPPMKAESQGGASALKAILRRRDLWGIYAATAFAVTGHFAAFTFIEPLIREAQQVNVKSIAMLLFAFGAAGVLGNVLTAAFIDRHLRTAMLAALGATSGSLILLGQFHASLSMAVLTAILIAWGAGVAAVFVGLQTWILRVSGSAAAAASAVYVAIFNAAIGTGAMAGAWVLAHSGLAAVMTVAGAAGAIAIAVVYRMGRPAQVPFALAQEA